MNNLHEETTNSGGGGKNLGPKSTSVCINVKGPSWDQPVEVNLQSIFSHIAGNIPLQEMAPPDYKDLDDDVVWEKAEKQSLRDDKSDRY